MPSLPKTKKTKSGKKTRGSAIDSAQRELLERQNAIQAQIDALQRSLEQDAKRPAEPETRPRYKHGATTLAGGRVTVAAIPTRRLPPKRPTMLRAERNAERTQTIALLVFLAGAVIYALSRLLP